jgi:hypothetical protein
MKTAFAACILVFFATSCSQVQTNPVAKVDEPEQKFITLGEEHCKNHKKLGQVLMEKTEMFLGKFHENGYRRALESEMILIFQCKDDKVFAFKGPNFETLHAVEIPQQSEHGSTPLPKTAKPEVSL